MEVTFKGEPLQLEGSQPQVGEQIPDFSLKNVTGKEIKKSDMLGNVVILSVFPDINTRVCAAQTRRFHEEASTIPGVKLLSVSKNTKEEMTDWCAANGIQMEMLPDEKGEFGKAFGINIPKLDKLARSVFVVNQEGKLAYKEILAEMTDEPNYEAAVEAAKDLR